MSDARRRQYVPLATHFATARTGTAILDRYGLEGLAVWTCLLARAKSSQIQGTVIWHSEAHAFGQLGLTGHEPSGFTFAEFVRFLGRLKQARTTRCGRESHTTLTRFGEWNQTIRSQAAAERNRSKRAQNRGNDLHTIEATEGEGEGEVPPTPLNGHVNSQVKSTPRRPRRNDNLVPCTHDYCKYRGTPDDLPEHLFNVHGDDTAYQSIAVPADSPDDDIDFRRGAA